jgi:hypothetical protein
MMIPVQGGEEASTRAGKAGVLPTPWMEMYEPDGRLMQSFQQWAG